MRCWLVERVSTKRGAHESMGHSDTATAHSTHAHTHTHTHTTHRHIGTQSSANGTREWRHHSRMTHIAVATPLPLAERARARGGPAGGRDGVGKEADALNGLVTLVVFERLTWLSRLNRDCRLVFLPHPHCSRRVPRTRSRA
eukprot:scaffold5610_cov137-Isochrysis_galbana.AAC.4